ncbi:MULTISPECIES: mechanosensitive ion channel domain-containing protein [Halolamina]|uniref:Mechanosensitive ion channel n=1 Tax=Halolamina pelagica TaxID=699431 RepID=A0A1I5RNZ9_9EURY|nr:MULTISPECIES: mechanosensitive ion channel domain-containing protein [Halolamina]NHX35273.1 mechanosensitive ion channel [Halolamina sp. R1-12]SFP60140.1 Mechanosensitive ion channel [Halolamina pelagica]
MAGPSAIQFGFEIGGSLGAIPERVWLAFAVFVLAAVLAWLVVRVNAGLLRRAGLPETIEGTAFERTVRGIGTSTVAIISQLSGWFILLLGGIVALSIAEPAYAEQFWSRTTGFFPRVFVAVLIVIVGVVVGDKVELLLSERLRSVKLPQVGIVPTAAKYSVFYVALVLALDQVGIATFALVVLLALYALALVVFTVVAGEQLLTSGAAGLYLFLNEPYGIGDTVRIGDQTGVVQEIDVFVTHIESDGEEYVVPNDRVFEGGIVIVHDD